MSSPPPGSSALVIGAALLLLGTAMAMVTRWPIYNVKGRKAWMERRGLWISFAGSVAAVWGAGEAIIGSGENLFVGGVLLAVALALSVLLLAPVVLRGPSGVKEGKTEEQPCDERDEDGVASVAGVCGAEEDGDQVIHVEGATESHAEHRKPPKAHPKASKS